MIKQQNLDGTWTAWGDGYLRPIIVEAETKKGAVRAYGDLYQWQMAEEYAFEQAMSHDPNHPDYGVDHG